MASKECGLQGTNGQQREKEREGKKECSWSAVHLLKTSPTTLLYRNFINQQSIQSKTNSMEFVQRMSIAYVPLLHARIHKPIA